MIDYAKRLVEVEAVLKHFPAKALEKIPEDIMQAISQGKDMEYTWEYDVTKALKDQDLSRDTIAILAHLNMEYILDDNQKKQMQHILELNEENYEASIQDYNFEEIFKNNGASSPVNEANYDEPRAVPAEYTGGFFKKLICKIKRILKK